ncbi:MAG: hypothetical protein MUE54_01390 [Anaerolineae bacterium]|jgi:hypothetical protein|nr:hypothetical protein [Anaerolineae bacterium]
MSIEGILLSAFLFLTSMMILAYPFVSKTVSHDALSRQQDRQSLLNSYERLLARLRDLDEDYRLGKMPQADYEIERHQLAERGATLLAQIEKSFGGLKYDEIPTSVPVPDAKADAELDTAIEAAIANYIAKTQDKEHATAR